MAVQLAFQAEFEYGNTKAIILKATVSGNYGVNGVGDLLNLEPTQNAGGDGGITDPKLAYNDIIAQPPSEFGVLNEAFGGSYLALLPNAAPTLKNLGMIMYEPGGAEKATAAAYSAGELAGFAYLIFLIPAQQ